LGGLTIIVIVLDAYHCVRFGSSFRVTVRVTVR